jgi:multidrug efflux system outer membrane protein
MRNISFLLLAIILIVSGCRVGRDYQRPTLHLPVQLDSTATAADTVSVGDLPWTAFFKDNLLQKLIGQAVDSNQDLQLAMRRLDIAGKEAAQARLIQLPEVQLQVNGQLNRPSDNSLNGLSTKTFLQKSYIENYQAALTVSWEADIWGKLRSRREATLSEYLRTTEATKAVQTQIVAEVAEGYYNLLMLDRQLTIARRNLALSDSFVTATRLLKDAGQVTGLALQQAISQQQTTALLIPQLEQDIAIQETSINYLVGSLPGRVQRGQLEDGPDNSSLPAGLPAALVGRRPDVQAAEWSLRAANARVGVAKANMYPALTITAGGGLETFTASNWFNLPGSLFGLAAGSIAQPIFQRRALRTQYEIAQIEREAAVTTFRQSVLRAVGEVKNGLVQLDKLAVQDSLAGAQVSNLRDAVKNAQLLFKSDMAIYLEVLTAQSNALQAELNQARIRRSRLSAVTQLYKALGGGWK